MVHLVGRAVIVIYFRNYYYLKAGRASPSGELSEGKPEQGCVYRDAVAAGNLHRPPEQRPLDIKFLVPRIDFLISIFLMTKKTHLWRLVP